MRILLVDNADSFTRNLEHLLLATVSGADVGVIPYVGLAEADPADFDLVVISPGPGRPEDYPAYARVFEVGRPVLGVCLGMQIINQWRGGRTAMLPGCIHGRAEVIDWNGQRRQVARYHSLHVTEAGRGLAVLARNDAGVIMALGSRTHGLLGYQFHPESFMTPEGGIFVVHALDFLGLR
ncbi:aminodeoxychorismate/anthranilate synthase component II [Pseudodesulfovibrio sp. F-1]|uniref:Aminodeoxychorismate/anthranilate synthase component II n=1 Tax=Pseudodesulfovibrio alkaliphilus TaxID=2661613 RepID=A0A7K1KND2_9BACT|nr:aminodeoxychorismate/anthranilate synthase component II [Pseudodesulfovibrio alkaliphilus]MUM77584.1 aminodeoxychorismate/anthranilate synthase component II [Pseudodesulfovibrio alkaliphilus]